ncbi:MAG: hypothetical protein HY821_00835 [Acidobacteria bacterium]|nr:hypothetical protein [Acidobacteriota bacterium]
MAKGLWIAGAFSLVAMAGSGVIGVAVSNGAMRVNQAQVSGNANLAEGSSVQAAADAARIQLTKGGRATLAPNSAARVYADKLVLESGVSVVSTPSYRVEARGLQIAATGGQAQVALTGGVVKVAALTGQAQVRNAEGLLLAKVAPGKVLDLTPGAGASAQSSVTGVLRQDGARYVVTDRLTNVDAELRGSNLQKELGQLVEASGTVKAGADRNSQVIEVARLNRVDDENAPQSGGQVPTGGGQKPTEGSKGPTKPTGTGMSAGTKVAIGVAIAGGAGAGIVFATMSR